MYKEKKRSYNKNKNKKLLFIYLFFILLEPARRKDVPRIKANFHNSVTLRSSQDFILR